MIPDAIDKKLAMIDGVHNTIMIRLKNLRWSRLTAEEQERVQIQKLADAYARAVDILLQELIPA